ncbi:glucan biosynthesis protein D [Frigidibacter sp. MR17.14]|uniref:glucan biosynthesis protein n=1 Tax=Frigidibacter sp. MR17.14 TaxID=3126509 RepID=UPI003012B724
MTITRRNLLAQTALVAMAGALPRMAFAQATAPQPFRFEELTARAEAMARAEYQAPYRPMPEVTAVIDYQTWGEIRFRTDRAPYSKGDGAYPVTFFHLGQYFQNRVRMFLVKDGQASEVAYDPELFDMPADSIARKLPRDAGFAGFRLQEAVYSPDWPTQDWVAFLGASYFRAIGASGQYGLSARGVVIDAAMPDRPEEFPAFTEFYIEETGDSEAPVTVCALLDGPSITGAFRFRLQRGMERTKGVNMEIESAMFLRRDVARLGLMPITSMFWYGEYGRERPFDWRPEVHDSDGLALWTGSGERIWRPLINPTGTQVAAFGDENPRGFGLLQRDRNFDHYRDGVFYDRRPCLWVEPIAPLGRGAVQLLEIPTNDEIHDNIGAFWVPEGPAKAGNRYDLHYRVFWQDNEPYPATNIAQTVSTRVGRGGQPGLPRPPGVYKVAVEFDRPEVMTRIPYGVFPKVEVTTSAGRIGGTLVEPVPNGNVWRAIFDLELPPEQMAELRMYLSLEGGPLTETWLYQFRQGNLIPVAGQ